jgi:type II secretory pathway pseudopilin PulG
MKRTYKSMMGVTLLEIMLVLAIAALVIVMSIRFYQSASNSNKVNAAVSQIQGIVAAAENYANANGGKYDFTNATLAPYLPGGSGTLNNPWGGSVTVAGGTAGTMTITYSAAIATEPCAMLKGNLEQSNKFKFPDCKVVTVTI